jgi:hypothetical protein
MVFMMGKIAASGAEAQCVKSTNVAAEAATHKARALCGECLWGTALEAAEKLSCFVILSEANNLYSI